MGAERPCDATSAAVFIVGLVAGTVCIIVSKMLFEGTAIGITGEVESFQPPVFESFIMFFGMIFALPMYLGVEGFKRFQAIGSPEKKAALAKEPEVTFKMLMSLGVPAIFDLSSVLFLMAGLMNITASMWMLLRGGCIVFVALMKQFALKSPLSPQMWLGVVIITLAVCLVGLAPVVSGTAAGGGGDGSGMLMGIAMTLFGTFLQSLQYAYEEKVLSGDTPAPPWLLIGMEGMFGSILSLVVVYPLAGIVPGADHGSFENMQNTITKLQDNPELVKLSAIFCVSVFVLNSFSVLVTFMLSSVWHAILDNFRPISIWATQLVIYQVTDGAHGEAWTRGSYLQLAGLAVMIAGTAIYNGTITVPGLPATDLLDKNSKASTPALSRSPLLTGNASPGSEFKGYHSPYAKRLELPISDGSEPLGRNEGEKGLRQKLMVKAAEAP